MFSRLSCLTFKTFREFDKEYQDSKFDKIFLLHPDTLLATRGRIEWVNRNLSYKYFYKNQNIKAIELNRNALDLLLNQHYLHKDRKYYSEIGSIYAHLFYLGDTLVGDPIKAIENMEIAIEMFPKSKDAIMSDETLFNLVGVYALIGDYKSSLDLVERLLVEPSMYNWWDFKYKAFFIKMFEGNTRFQAIVNRDEQKFRSEAIVKDSY